MPAHETEALATALKADAEAGAPVLGPKTSGWISGAATKVAAGSWSLAKGVSTSAVAKLILEYLGIG